MGFKRDVECIMSYLPRKESRQTLLFSATVPNEVKSVIKETMRKNYVTVDCIHDTDPASHTNAQVQQSHVIIPSASRLVSGTVEILAKLIADTKAANETLKLVVFFNTAHSVGFYADLFAAMPKLTHRLQLFELHSRKSQAYRTRTSDEFRAAKEGILFTSDVSARGVDYPGVTDVVQVCIVHVPSTPIFSRNNIRLTFSVSRRNFTGSSEFLIQESHTFIGLAVRVGLVNKEKAYLFYLI
jgi:ATP-dependent RNA helicase MSS116, mitochondrial